MPINVEHPVDPVGIKPLHILISLAVVSIPPPNVGVQPVLSDVKRSPVPVPSLGIPQLPHDCAVPGDHFAQPCVKSHLAYVVSGNGSLTHREVPAQLIQKVLLLDEESIELVTAQSAI